ncbi:MAG: hypothetical protein CBC22_06905 [Alphaproteobacteria bacterium TMED62]|nr:MAG: hypothetical protein CBC22_06905 [Alphaproteobacteria bacterium TMED62]
MSKKKYSIIRKKILSYYENNKRNLPWRTKQDNNQNPYFTLVSEVMLQQTQVNTALGYYKKFIKKWPTVCSLAKANDEDILTLWAGLGYYSRAKNLLKAAKIITVKYDGIIPNKYEDLISLPGIGEYTASAIISFAFGKFSVVIDTNVKRFIGRVNGLEKIININKNEFNKLGVKLFPKENSGKFAQAIMDFSSDICTKIKPSCSKCFLKLYCEFDETLEEKSKKKKIKKKYSLVFFYILKKKFFFLRKRPLKVTLGGMYEVPGTDWIDKKWPKIPEEINSINALPRTIKYKFSNINLETKIYKLHINKKKVFNEQGIWIESKDLKKFPLSVLTRRIINYSLNS